MKTKEIRIIKSTKTSLVAPLILENEEEDLLNNQNKDKNERLSINNTKKRMPSQAYKQSARNSQKLTLELNKINLNNNENKSNNKIEYQTGNLQTTTNNNNTTTTTVIIEKLNKIGWKTILCTLFLIIFSIGVLIGTLVSVHKLPKQGFYLFLVIGLLVLFPACYAGYQVIGKLFGW